MFEIPTSRPLRRRESILFSPASFQKGQARSIIFCAHDLRVAAMDVNTTSFTSPLANANFGGNVPPQVEYLLDALKGVTFWTGLWTLLALAVVYDQCTQQPY